MRYSLKTACGVKRKQEMGRTRASHADLLQVFILDVVEVGEPRDVELIADPQEVLLQLHIRQQLQQPLCPLLTLHLHTHIHKPLFPGCIEDSDPVCSLNCSVLECDANGQFLYGLDVTC